MIRSIKVDPLVEAIHNDRNEINQYADKHKLMRYDMAAFPDSAISCGGRPLTLIVAALIRDNKHLRTLVNTLLEPVK